MRKYKGLLWFAGLVLAMFLATWLLDGVRFPEASEQTSDRSGDRYSVELNCERVVRENLVSPATMKVVPGRAATQVSAGTWRYVFEVDSQNSFGALIRSRWSCEVVGDRVTAQQVER